MTLKARIDSAKDAGTVREWRTHDAIKQAIRMGGDAFKEISLVLEQLRKLREQADYVLRSRDWTWEEVHEAVRSSRWLIRNRIKMMSDAEFRRLHVPRG